MKQIRLDILAAGLAGSVCLIACASSSSSAPQPRTEPLPALGASTPVKAASPGPDRARATSSAGAATSPAAPGVAGSPGVLDAGKIVVGSTRAITYDASDGKGDVVAEAEGTPDCHCTRRTWWVREFRVTPAGRSGAAEHERHYTFDRDGNLAVIEEIDRVDKVEVEYTPPMVVVPDRLHVQAGEGKAAFTQSVNMVVHPLGDRSKVRTHGPTTVEIRYVGDEGIKTGEGIIPAHKLVSTITASLTAAKTIDTTESWWADGIGLVGQKDEEKTTVLGAKVRDNAETLVMKRRAPR